MAVNCCVAPLWMLAFAGVTAIEFSVGVPATMVMLSALLLVAAGLAESLTRTVKLEVAAAVGVPLMVLVLELKVRPLGSEPLAMDQL